MRLVGQLEADGVAAGHARPGDVHEARPLAEASAVQLEPALERLELTCGRGRVDGGALEACVSLEFFMDMSRACVSLEFFMEPSRRWRGD